MALDTLLPVTPWYLESRVIFLGICSIYLYIYYLRHKAGLLDASTAEAETVEATSSGANLVVVKRTVWEFIKDYAVPVNDPAAKEADAERAKAAEEPKTKASSKEKRKARRLPPIPIKAKTKAPAVAMPTPAVTPVPSSGTSDTTLTDTSEVASRKRQASKDAARHYRAQKQKYRHVTKEGWEDVAKDLAEVEKSPTPPKVATDNGSTSSFPVAGTAIVRTPSKRTKPLGEEFVKSRASKSYVPPVRVIRPSAPPPAVPETVTAAVCGEEVVEKGKRWGILRRSRPSPKVSPHDSPDLEEVTVTDDQSESTDDTASQGVGGVKVGKKRTFPRLSAIGRLFKPPSPSRERALREAVSFRDEISLSDDASSSYASEYLSPSGEVEWKAEIVSYKTKDIDGSGMYGRRKKTLF